MLKMTNTSTIRVVTVLDVMRDNFYNGRQYGSLMDRKDDIRLDSAFSSEDKRREYDAESEQITEQMDYIPEPTNLAGLIAFEFGKLVG